MELMLVSAFKLSFEAELFSLLVVKLWMALHAQNLRQLAKVDFELPLSVD